MKKIILLVVAAIIGITACKKDETVVLKTNTVVIDATSRTLWKKFSFEKNDTVANTDTTDAWDIAFKRNNIISNSGTSGKGKVGVYLTDKKGEAGYNALTEVPENATFISDEMLDVAIQGGYVKQSGNVNLSKWFTMGSSTQATQIIPTDYIYIIKTTKGKYAKLWVKSYYNAESVSGHVTIQYFYQPNGSKSLK